MYISAHFKMEELADLQEAIRAVRLASFITSSAGQLNATPLPLFLDDTEGEYGVLYGHLAKANSQWKNSIDGEALAIFMGPDAYVTPSWYETKRQTGKVVPTWNYVAVHAHGVPEFFHDERRLLDVVTRLTNLQEGQRDQPWQVSDASATYIEKQLGGIVGLRLPVTRLAGSRKMSQNKTREDRIGVAEGLCEHADAADQRVSALIPR